MRSKNSYLLVILMSRVFETRIFNFCIDFLERKSNKNKLKEKQVFFLKNKERIKRNIELLEDSKSKKVYENILKYRASLKRCYLKDICNKDHYFDLDIIKIGEGEEVFLDCGAYTGDTILQLSNIFYKKLRKKGKLSVICCEPDKKNSIRCEETIKKLEKKFKTFQGRVIRKGIWKEENELYFNDGNEYASKIESQKEEKYIKIEVDSIDNIVKNIDEKITYIKMDIEGVEPEALIGAEMTISKFHPTLAISIYHTDEQMIGILETLHKKYPFYKYYIRHYSYGWTETILYAVCK